MVPQAEHRDVKVGNSVTLGCTLTKPEDVLQVTWQKDSEELHNNIATYSTMKGLKIHESYQGRMNFTSLVLNETSITFWDTRMDDSGCYTCLFNTFPLGSMSGRTCLSVFGEILCRDMSLVEKEVFCHSQHFPEQTQKLSTRAKNCFYFSKYYFKIWDFRLSETFGMCNFSMREGVLNHEGGASPV